MAEKQTEVRNIVIIGGVAAGLKSAAKVRRGDPRAKITVIERGDIVSYGACGMPYVVSGNVASIDHLMMTPNGSIRNPSFFKATKNLDVLTKTEALRIDRLAKTVRIKNLADGEEKDIPYDKLVIATGSTPVESGRILPLSPPRPGGRWFASTTSKRNPAPTRWNGWLNFSPRFPPPR